MNENCVMQFNIHIDLLIQMVTTGYKSAIECVTGLPEGTTYVSQFFDPNTHLVHIVVRHSSFKALNIGDPIPKISIRLANWDVVPREDIETAASLPISPFPEA